MQLLLFMAKLVLNWENFQDDANWKQYAVHAPDVPVQKECWRPLDNIQTLNFKEHYCLIKMQMQIFFYAKALSNKGL